jgi:hypothetical protein
LKEDAEDMMRKLNKMKDEEEDDEEDMGIMR